MSFPTAQSIDRVGFVGLGVMGQPMAMNLQRSGVQLVVWNRTPERCAPLVVAGARQAGSLEDLFAETRTVILMLANERATDRVLDRDSSSFAKRVSGKRIIGMGTNSPEWSERLAGDLNAAGAQYIEAPVSGSSKPAVEGTLVAMIAGSSEEARSEVAHLISPMCRETFDAGSVPSALRLKLSVNLFLITMVTGLAEAAALAKQIGIEWSLLRSVLDAGPMASDVMRMKLAKLVGGDFSAQASIRDVLMNCQLVAGAAQHAGFYAPLLAHSLKWFDSAQQLGLSDEDMIGVIKAIDARPSAPSALIAEQLDAYNKRDLDRFMRCWSADAKIVGFPDKEVLAGAAAIRNHHQKRFEDTALRATLLNRTALGDLVVDHELVTGSGNDGIEAREVLAIYTVQDGLISRASFKQQERTSKVSSAAPEVS